MQLPRPDGGALRHWPRPTIHDTVATIARQPVFDRSMRQTLLERVMRWIGELFARLDEAVGGLPHARRVATIAAILVALLVVGRLLYAGRLRDASAGSRLRNRLARHSGGDPLIEAEHLAAEGRYTDAAHALYHGVVEHLARSGEVRPHRSKTTGDYARELRARDSRAQHTFRRFARRYDRILFGEGRCDAVGYEALLADARPVLEAVSAGRAA